MWHRPSDQVGRLTGRLRSSGVFCFVPASSEPQQLAAHLGPRPVPAEIHVLQDLRDTQNITAPTEASQQATYQCGHCDSGFVSAHGLHMHVSRMHRDKLTRYIPADSDRGLHATDGLPVCAACNKEFKQWKGLRDHLLSAACPRPAELNSYELRQSNRLRARSCRVWLA